MDASLDARDVVGAGQLVGDPGDLDADINGTDGPEPVRDEIRCDGGDVVVAEPSARQRHQRHVPGGRHTGGVAGPHKSHNARHPMRQVHMSTSLTAAGCAYTAVLALASNVPSASPSAE